MTTAGVLVGCQLASGAHVPALATPARLLSVRQVAIASPATLVAAVTGASSLNETDRRWQIKGTDLGILWEGRSGDILAAFGDTFGSRWSGHGSVGTPAANGWRSNTLARSDDRDLADGMTVDSFTHDTPGQARELLSSQKVDGGEMTVVPTAGIAVDGRDYVHYMSVRHWITHGRWTTNHSGIAWSDDGGETWVKDPDARWPNRAGAGDTFQMAAFARSDGYVYVFGTPSGRGGDVRLARVPENELLVPDAYRYWDGVAWSPSIGDARPIVPAPVGEMSVQFNAYLGQWTMLHVVSPADDDVRSIVLRSANRPTGPWSPPQVLATSDEHPGLYGGFIHPWSASSGDAELYFTMSLWEPYNVYLMRTTVSPQPAVR